MPANTSCATSIVAFSLNHLTLGVWSSEGSHSLVEERTAPDGSFPIILRVDLAGHPELKGSERQSSLNRRR